MYVYIIQKHEYKNETILVLYVFRSVLFFICTKISWNKTIGLNICHVKYSTHISKNY